MLSLPITNFRLFEHFSKMDDLSTCLFGALITACLLYVGRFLRTYSHLIRPSFVFFFTNFLHPIGGKDLKQQNALENFYKLQVCKELFSNILILILRKSKGSHIRCDSIVAAAGT